MVPLHHPIPITLCTQTPEPFQFQFNIPSKTNPPLKFTFISTSPYNSLPYRPFPSKRARPLSDVDGNANGVNEGRKKRRLRLHLITSRLSSPFSVPASNIVNRGGCAKNLVLGGRKRFGAGVKKDVGKNVLRKIAILNRIRLQMDGARGCMRGCHFVNRGKERVELALDVNVHLKEIGMGKQNKRWNEFVLPPSPLGRSNYDALDYEDEMLMDEEGDGREKEIYSDFSVMCPSRSGVEGDDYEYLDTLDGLSPEDMQDQPPSPPSEEGIAEMLREEGKQHDGCLVSLGGT